MDLGALPLLYVPGRQKVVVFDWFA